jgi:hypothetical protein
VSGSARARQRLRIARIPVRFLAEGQEAVGQLKNVSRAGVFVRASDLPRPGAVVALQFRSPQGSLVDVRGEVRWNTQGLALDGVVPGFGVLLYEPPREFREFFAWAVARVDDEKGSEAEGV